MNIHQIEQRILINELMNKQTVNKKMLADALIAGGYRSELNSQLPVGNAVRMHMIALQVKCKHLGFKLYTRQIGGPQRTVYTITFEAVKYIAFNHGVPQYNEMGEMVDQLYAFPKFSQEEEE